MSKLVLKKLSNTQRIVVERVTIRGESRVEIKKEHRKTIDSDWTPSKGITIPIDDVPTLVTILKETIGDEGVENCE